MLGMLLGAIAPTLANAVKDMAFGKAVDFVKDHTGIDLGHVKDHNDIDALDLDVIKKIKEGDIYLQLKEEENRHGEAMYDKTLKEQQAIIDADMKDKEQARDIYKMQQGSSSIFTRHFLEIFTIIITTAVFMIFFFILAGDTSKLDANTKTVVIEFAKAVFLLVIGFWFGSSHGSKVAGQNIVKMNSHHNTLTGEFGDSLGNVSSDELDGLY
jgi:hypothetical protein